MYFQATTNYVWFHSLFNHIWENRSNGSIDTIGFRYHRSTQSCCFLILYTRGSLANDRIVDNLCREQHETDRFIYGVISRDGRFGRTNSRCGFNIAEACVILSLENSIGLTCFMLLPEFAYVNRGHAKEVFEASSLRNNWKDKSPS